MAFSPRAIMPMASIVMLRSSQSSMSANGMMSFVCRSKNTGMVPATYEGATRLPSDLHCVADACGVAYHGVTKGNGTGCIAQAAGRRHKQKQEEGKRHGNMRTNRHTFVSVLSRRT